MKGCIAALLVAWSGAVILAQTQGGQTPAAPAPGTEAAGAQTQKVTTPEELDKSMKAAQKSMQGTQAAIKAGAPEDARKQLTALRTEMVSSREFWVIHKKDDAQKWNDETVAKIEGVDKALAATPFDPSAAAAALKELGGSCLACHKAYRARDAENNWALKPGSIGG